MSANLLDILQKLLKNQDKILQTLDRHEQVLKDISKRLEVGDDFYFKPTQNLQEFEDMEQKIADSKQFRYDLKEFIISKAGRNVKEMLQVVFDDCFLHKNFNSNGKNNRINLTETGFYRRIYLRIQELYNIDASEARTALMKDIRTIKNRINNRKSDLKKRVNTNVTKSLVESMVEHKDHSYIEVKNEPTMKKPRLDDGTQDAIEITHLSGGEELSLSEEEIAEWEEVDLEEEIPQLIQGQVKKTYQIEYLDEYTEYESESDNRTKKEIILPIEHVDVEPQKQRPSKQGHFYLIGKKT